MATGASIPQEVISVLMWLLATSAGRRNLTFPNLFRSKAFCEHTHTHTTRVNVPTISLDTHLFLKSQFTRYSHNREEMSQLALRASCFARARISPATSQLRQLSAAAAAGAPGPSLKQPLVGRTHTYSIHGGGKKEHPSADRVWKETDSHADHSTRRSRFGPWTRGTSSAWPVHSRTG